MTKLLTSIFFLSIITLSGCGIPLPLQKDLVVKDLNAVRQFATTNPVFSEYVQEFEQRGRIIMNDGSFTVGDIPINFGDTENDSFQGVCFEYPDGTKEVIIRQSWWNGASDEYRESLVFHELGHCRLGRDHLDDVRAVGNGTHKVSMMNSIIVAPQNYKDHKDGYHKELFTYDAYDLFLSLGVLVN